MSGGWLGSATGEFACDDTHTQAHGHGCGWRGIGRLTRADEAEAFAAEMHRAKAFGWLYAGATFVLCIGAFIASIRFGLIGGVK